MSLNSYVNQQLRKLGGAGLYVVCIALFVLLGKLIPQVPFYAMMGLGGLAHIAGTKAYFFVAKE